MKALRGWVTHCWTPLLRSHFTPVPTTTLPVGIDGCTVCHGRRKTRHVIYSKADTVPLVAELLRGCIKRKLLGTNKREVFL